MGGEEEEEGAEEEEMGAEEEEEGEEEEESGADEELEDRVVDLEDKLDELIAEFESMMDDSTEGDEDFDMVAIDDEVGGDAMQDDDTAEFADVEEMMSENVDLKAAPKPITATTAPAPRMTKPPPSARNCRQDPETS